MQTATLATPHHPQIESDDAPCAFDQYVVMHGVTWKQYLAFLEARGEAQSPKMFYLDGELEFMSPSRTHEETKTILARLVELYALECGIDLYGFGSMTMTEEPKEAGLEPDECYAVGHDIDDEAGERPDLALEVVWTSGSLSKLEIYRRLGVREVWQWKRGAIRIFSLVEGEYQERALSEFLPELLPAVLCSYLEFPQPVAVRRFQADLRAASAGKTP